MNEVKHEELFGNLKSFLKTKGIELQEGTYTHRVQQGCEILADSINVSQRTLKSAKSAVGKGLDQIRQTIHEQTAPKAPPAAGASQKKRPSNKTRAASQPAAAPKKTNKSGRRTGKM